MDSRKIGMVVAAVTSGSLRKAAKECGCSQSAMTQAMDSLEAELGFKLIVRSHRGVTLTPAGERLWPSLVKAATALDGFMTEAAALSQDVNAPIRLGVIGGIAGSWLPAALQAFRKRHPELSFEIMVGSDCLAHWMDEGLADLAIGSEELCGAHRFWPLMDEPCFVVLPKGVRVGADVLSQEGFASLPFVMAPKGSVEGDVPQSLVYCDDDAALISMAASGEGAAVVPQSALRNGARGLQVMELDPLAYRTIGVALPNTPREGAQAFATYLQDNMPYTARKEETPEEVAMRMSIRRALTGATSRSWVSPVFR